MNRADENKAVVRRFLNDVLAAGNVALADEVLAPDYVNTVVEELTAASTDIPVPNYPETASSDATRLKAAITSLRAKTKGLRFEELAMGAAGDEVFARFLCHINLPDGTTRVVRSLAYYRLRDGRIVLNDVMGLHL